MKKFLVLPLALAIAFTMLACGGGAPATTPDPAPAPAPAPAADAADPAPAPEADPAPASDLKVAVFYYSYPDVYIGTVRDSMDAQLNSLGIQYQNFDGENNQGKQSEQIQTAVTDGYNMLIVNIVDTMSPDAAQNAVELAKEKDIPIVFFNREVDDSVVNSYDKCAFVGTNAPEAGHMQGQMVGEYLVANYDAVDINGDGTISYVMLKGQEGNAEADARTQFGVEDADKVLTAAGKPALAFYDANNAQKYLLDQDGAWSPLWGTNHLNTIMSMYNEGNGNMVELVIANNDGMAEGAVAALQSAGYNTGDGRVIPVFGVDAVDSAKALIDAGAMTGTVMQDAAGMATHICSLIENVKGGAALMDGIADKYNVDAGIDKVRVPYGLYQ